MVLSELVKDHRIILASQSPRRKMLLAGLDLEFEVIVKPDIPEDVPSGIGMNEIPVHLADSKAAHYIHLLNEKTIVITADTIVWHKNTLVGKPKNAEDAIRILTALSGDMHEVVTGVCIQSAGRKKLFHSHSKVFFRSLTKDEIEYYIHKYKPLDKAGSYGIQEWVGYVGIEKIEGSFYNVMGLPVQQLYQELINFIQP